MEEKRNKEVVMKNEASRLRVPEKCSLGGRSIDAVLRDLVAVIQVPQLLECQHRPMPTFTPPEPSEEKRRERERERKFDVSFLGWRLRWTLWEK